MFVGNLYDKYGTKNPIARFLMRRFLSQVSELARSTAAREVLDVGCGEGHLSQHLLRQLELDHLCACDLSLARIVGDADPRIEFRAASVYELPYASAAFDLVVCCEVLEHLEHPERAVAELRRVTRRWALVSTPYEPWFRTMNVLRGAYWRDFGNTPGHVQHFGPASLKRLLTSEFELVRLETPLPWIVALAQVA